MIFYITYIDLENVAFLGMREKVLAQADAIEKGLGKTYYTFWSKQIAFLMCGENIIEKDVAVTREEYKHILIGWMEKYEVDRTYIRYPFANLFFLELLAYQKEHGIKTVLEIPTYPYENELPYCMIKVEDIYYRGEISCFVDMISTFSSDKEIWGIPCINLMNGVDVDKIPLAQTREKGFIEMVAVASMSFWHGYERLIEGLYEYYSKAGELDVHLKLIGDGGENDLYERLVEKYSLQTHVEFCGALRGEDLDKHLAKADIAIGSLGLYKIGLNEVSPIKSAEYCARGIPMVLGYCDIRFPNDLNFVLQVPNDDSPIDISAVIEFYKNVHTNENYQIEMRNYAEKILKWENIMHPVVEYLS